ncbi:MAG: TetR/AcrR family transcriptional regulator [Nocardioides alkalitolerans]
MDRRRHQLVDAAMTAMAENRWRSATVSSICATAGLNKRYFYESFESLDTLADAVVDQVAAEVTGAALAAQERTTGQSAREQARAAVAAVVTTLGSDRRRALVLLAGSAGAPSAHLRRMDALRRMTATFVDHALLWHRDRGIEPLTPTAIAFLIGGTAQAILSWTEGELPVDAEQLVDEVTASWLSLGQPCGSDDA